MAVARVKTLTITVDETRAVSGLLQVPREMRACYVLAHGAGAGMTHPFLAAVADALAERAIGTLRYHFPYMEQGGKRPDPPAVAQRTVRAAVAEAGRRAPDVPLIVGGKSYGGRMTSQAQARAPLPGVRGLVFLGFPLHSAGRPSIERAEHLFEVRVPMLFLQGTRDPLARTPLLEDLVQRLGTHATLHVVPEADHSFHVPARTGRTDADVRAELMDAMAEWIDKLLARTVP